MFIITSCSSSCVMQEDAAGSQSVASPTGLTARHTFKINMLLVESLLTIQFPRVDDSANLSKKSKQQCIYGPADCFGFLDPLANNYTQKNTPAAGRDGIL